MEKNNRKILDLKEMGFKELFISLLPIFAAYNIFGVSLSIIILILLTLVSVVKFHKKDLLFQKPLVLFILYYIIHEIILYFIAEVPININYRIEKIIYFLSMLIIIPTINFSKLKSSLNFISIICILGLSFHVVTIVSGGVVHPIELPGLSLDKQFVQTLSTRPSSFFTEPAHYSQFMLAPICISLIDKKYIWMGILTIAMFLTTSTTGIFIAFVMLSTYALTQRTFKFRKSVGFIIVAIGLLYLLLSSSLFESGINKIENTDVETNVRIQQGPLIVSTMDLEEMVFGVKYGSPDDYCYKGKGSTAILRLQDEHIYMSTIWFNILCFGFVGLFLYLWIFFKMVKVDREVLPYVVSLFVIMFTSAISLSIFFVFSVIVLYSIAYHYNKTIQHESSSHR